jgi:hypothetical protein
MWVALRRPGRKYTFLDFGSDNLAPPLGVAVEH